MSGLTFVNQVGAVDGVNQAAPGAFIPDTYVRWAQDVLFDRAGYMRRRAPFTLFKLYNNDTPPIEAQPSVTNERIIGVFSTINPVGDRIIGLAVTTGGESRVLFYNKDFRESFEAALDLVPRDAIFDCKQASTGGMWLSFLESYAAGEGPNEYFQYFWFGGCGEEQTVTGVNLGHIHTSPSKHSTYTNVITGVFDVTTVTPGMFVYVEYSGDDYYAGTIKSVSETTIELEKDIIRFAPSVDISGAAYNANLTIKLRNVRPYIHVHGRGLITRAAASTTVVSGSVGTEGEGHFKSAGLNSSWALYRASTGEWIGDVVSVADNAALTLDSDQNSISATSVLQADEYIARKYTAVPSPIISGNDPSNVAGIFNATYAGYQWYGNAGDTATRNRVVFSAYHDAEAVDLSADAADSIIIPGTTEMRGMASSTSGLLVFLADKTYIIRGNYRANFSLEELYPQGCLSSMSIVEYGGGVFWASKLGILYYDGASVRNLTETNLGVYFTDSIKSFSSESDRVYGFLHKDYLFMHFTSFDSVYNPVRYEPIYAEGISTTPAIAEFPDYSWDPDFSVDDFNPANNVPVYWDYIQLYKSTGTGSSGRAIKWGERFASAGVTSGSKTLTGLTGITTGFVGMGVYGAGIASGAIIESVNAGAGTAVMNIAATSSHSPTSLLIVDALWGDDANTNQIIWGPVRQTEGITFAIYIPTNALTVLSNFDFRGAIKLDATDGLRALMGANIIDESGDAFARLIDADSILDVHNDHSIAEDEALIENSAKDAANYIKGPDFYIQTKHFTVGDPILRKWFRQLFLNLYLIDGSLRLDLVDTEDKDQIDIQKKKHRNWELFVESLYTWRQMESVIFPRELSPNRSSWANVENLNQTWYQLADAEFERRKKKISWRYPALGFRLYQMNNYRPKNSQVAQRPHTVMVDAWNIGFKPMRQSRV